MFTIAIVAVVVFAVVAIVALMLWTRTSSEDLTDRLRRSDPKAAARVEEQRAQSGSQNIGLGGPYH